MKIINMSITVDDIPKSCRGNYDLDYDQCLFCKDKTCALLAALSKTSYVGSNYANINDNCPLKQ